MEKEDHKRSENKPKNKDVSHDRHSRMGVNPNPKREGHGGWGVEGRDEEALEIAGPDDPLYDPDEDEEEAKVEE